MQPWENDADLAIIDAIAYNAWPHVAKVVTARKSHLCSMVEDVSWGRACRTVRPGERYVRVTVFWPCSHAPLSAAVCAACADGCHNLPRIPESVNA